MAEESSPLSPSSENSPLSHKRRITQNPSPNLSLEIDSSTLEVGTSQSQQQTQSFPQQSPKKPKFSSLNHSPTSDEGCIIDDEDDTQKLEKKQLILDDNGKVECQEKGSEIDQLGGENLNVGDKIEVSELGLVKNDVGVDQKEVIEDLSGETVNLDDKNEVSDMGFVRNDEGFDKKEVIDEFLGVKDEAVDFGCDKKDENAENFDGVLPKIVNNEDSASSSLIIEVMDGTALVEEKRNRRRGNNHNHNHESNSRNNAIVSEVSKEGKKKCVYSRKELEVLRYVNVKGQRKFWQEIYNGFSATVKKEYDEVGSSKHHENCNNGGIMGTCSTGPNYNNSGILDHASSSNLEAMAVYNPASTVTDSQQELTLRILDESEMLLVEVDLNTPDNFRTLLQHLLNACPVAETGQGTVPHIMWPWWPHYGLIEYYDVEANPVNLLDLRNYDDFAQVVKFGVIRQQSDHPLIVLRVYDDMMAIESSMIIPKESVTSLEMLDYILLVYFYSYKESHDSKVLEGFSSVWPDYYCSYTTDADSAISRPDHSDIFLFEESLGLPHDALEDLEAEDNPIEQWLGLESRVKYINLTPMV